MIVEKQIDTNGSSYYLSNNVVYIHGDPIRLPGRICKIEDFSVVGCKLLVTGGSKLFLFTLLGGSIKLIFEHDYRDKIAAHCLNHDDVHVATFDGNVFLNAHSAYKFPGPITAALFYRVDKDVKVVAGNTFGCVFVDNVVQQIHGGTIYQIAGFDGGFVSCSTDRRVVFFRREGQNIQQRELVSHPNERIYKVGVWDENAYFITEHSKLCHDNMIYDFGHGNISCFHEQDGKVFLRSGSNLLIRNIPAPVLVYTDYKIVRSKYPAFFGDKKLQVAVGGNVQRLDVHELPRSCYNADTHTIVCFRDTIAFYGHLSACKLRVYGVPGIIEATADYIHLNGRLLTYTLRDLKNKGAPRDMAWEDFAADCCNVVEIPVSFQRVFHVDKGVFLLANRYGGFGIFDQTTNALMTFSFGETRVVDVLSTDKLLYVLYQKTVYIARLPERREFGVKGNWVFHKRVLNIGEAIRIAIIRGNQYIFGYENGFLKAIGIRGVFICHCGYNPKNFAIDESKFYFWRENSVYMIPLRRIESNSISLYRHEYTGLFSTEDYFVGTSFDCIRIFDNKRTVHSEYYHYHTDLFLGYKDNKLIIFNTDKEATLFDLELGGASISNRVYLTSRAQCGCVFGDNIYLYLMEGRICLYDLNITLVKRIMTKGSMVTAMVADARRLVYGDTLGNVYLTDPYLENETLVLTCDGAVVLMQLWNNKLYISSDDHQFYVLDLATMIHSRQTLFSFPPKDFVVTVDGCFFLTETLLIHYCPDIKEIISSKTLPLSSTKLIAGPDNKVHLF